MARTNQLQQFFQKVKNALSPTAHKAADRWNKLIDFKGRKKALYEQWNTAAEQGSREAAYKLLMLYFDEGEEYYPLAYKWTEHLAQEGSDSGVLLQLAQMYEKGHGTPADKAKALMWYERCLSLHIYQGKNSSLSVDSSNFVQERIQELRLELKK